MLPNLIVIGAMKSATSSLHYYLGLHPAIQMSKKKELDYFILEKNWDKGSPWYESHFSAEANIIGESSPNYTKFPWFKGVPQRMHATVPDAKLIYILRDPIDRILSEYVHIRNNGGEKRTFEAIVSQTVNNWYIDNSKYFMQIEQYLEFFPKSQILILSSENLGLDAQQTMETVFRFLGVEESFSTSNFSQRLHKSGNKGAKNKIGRLLSKRVGGKKAEDYLLPNLPNSLKKTYFAVTRKKMAKKPELNENMKQSLASALEKDIKQLREFTGCPFDHWSI
jgi:sulfotransferase family protein